MAEKLKPLPDISNESAMLARGRMSAMWGALNDAREVLRDAGARCQSREPGSLELLAATELAIAAAERIAIVAGEIRRMTNAR